MDANCTDLQRNCLLQEEMEFLVTKTKMSPNRTTDTLEVDTGGIAASTTSSTTSSVVPPSIYSGVCVPETDYSESESEEEKEDENEKVNEKQDKENEKVDEKQDGESRNQVHSTGWIIDTSKFVCLSNRKDNSSSNLSDNSSASTSSVVSSSTHEHGITVPETDYSDNEEEDVGCQYCKRQVCCMEEFKRSPFQNECTVLKSMSFKLLVINGSKPGANCNQLKLKYCDNSRKWLAKNMHRLVPVRIPL